MTFDRRSIFPPMKMILLFVVALTLPSLAGSWDPEYGTLPSAAGQSPRYQLAQGSIIDNKGNIVPQTVRIDTWTGQTWTLTNVGGQTWIQVPESDSEILVKVRAMQSEGK